MTARIMLVVALVTLVFACAVYADADKDVDTSDSCDLGWSCGPFSFCYWEGDGTDCCIGSYCEFYEEADCCPDWYTSTQGLDENGKQKADVRLAGLGLFLIGGMISGLRRGRKRGWERLLLLGLVLVIAL